MVILCFGIIHTDGYRKITGIKDYRIFDLRVREATIEECMKELTPSEYQKIYGNVLKAEYLQAK